MTARLCSEILHRTTAAKICPMCVHQFPVIGDI